MEDFFWLAVLVDRAREDMGVPGRLDRTSYTVREYPPLPGQQRILTVAKIFSHASPFASVPDSMKRKVEASGLGYMSPWSPQQYILSHPVRAF